MTFEKKETPISGCFELLPKVFMDGRGKFVKTFHAPDFMAHGLETDFKEEYFSVSNGGVLRGLHFQKPPHDHVKMVYCPVGEVFDAVVDLRRESPTYGRHAVFSLNSEKNNILYIPKGLAHGFYTISDTAVLMYKVSSIHSPEHDSGILWNSAGIAWPHTSPRISERDLSFEPFRDFKSPFI